jgi:tripartite-type tricarboxylate transporter receptor subunit TctC
MKRIAATALATFLQALPAVGQEWPTKGVRIIVPFAAGATPDLVARLIADDLHQKLGHTFIVENKPGASGNTGTDAVAKANPDGATIRVSIGGPLAINPLLFGKLPYDPKKDLTLITMLATQPSVLAINANLGVDNVHALIDLIKRNPGKYNFGSIGTGSLSHLAMEAIAIQSGTQLVHVPYSSSPQAVTALIRDDVQMACLPAISVVPQVHSGAIKILAVSTAKRSALLPDIPTLKEAGIDVEADAWMGMIGPAGLPETMVTRIGDRAKEALMSAATRDKLAAQFMEPIPGAPAEFRKRIEADVARWKPVIEARILRSIRLPGDGRSRDPILRSAELEVYARLDFLDIEIGVRCVGRRRRGREIERLRSEAEIVVFDAHGPVVGERVFEAGADGPAGAHEGGACVVPEHVGEAAVVLREGNAALAVDEQTVEGGADAAGDGRRPVRRAVDGVADGIGTLALESEPGPAEIALDTEHQHVQLIIGADLAAAEEARAVE